MLALLKKEKRKQQIPGTTRDTTVIALQRKKCGVFRRHFALCPLKQPRKEHHCHYHERTAARWTASLSRKLERDVGPTLMLRCTFYTLSVLTHSYIYYRTFPSCEKHMPRDLLPEATNLRSSFQCNSINRTAHSSPTW